MATVDSSWDRSRDNDILTLMVHLIDRGAEKGVAITRDDIALALDWPVTKVDRIVRYLKQHPEYGFGVSFKRGRSPWCVASTEDAQIQDPAVRYEVDIARSGVLEGIYRIGRYVGAEAAHYTNIAAKTTIEGRFAARTKRAHRNMLVGLQNVLDPRKPDESAAIEFLERILQAV